jgi:copper(I)-binding protein
MRKKIVFGLLGIAALLLVLAACTGASQNKIVIKDAWGRPSPQVASNGAFYMVIQNRGDEADKLLAARSSACMMTELHQTVMNDQGVMEMRPVSDGIEIPAGGQVELKVGGLHVMCMDKMEAFKPGAKIPLTLRFEKAGEISIEVEIRQP